MSFIGVITSVKNEAYVTKVAGDFWKEEQIIFITDKNIQNMKNIRFETIVIDTTLKQVEYLKSLLSNTKYVILNADIVLEENIFKNLNLIVVTYGFQNKATFTVSSVSEGNIIICLQRIIKSIGGAKFEPQEFEVKNTQNIDIHAMIYMQIMLLIYDKIHILVS